TRTQAHIWAKSYNRKLDNVFGVEGEVAKEIASVLKTKLLPREKARIARMPTRDPQAYNLFLKANYFANRFFNRGNTKDPAKAVLQASALYHQAAARDPHFALAWARLSILESHAWWFGVNLAASSRMAKARKA